MKNVGEELWGFCGCENSAKKFYMDEYEENNNSEEILRDISKTSSKSFLLP